MNRKTALILATLPLGITMAKYRQLESDYPIAKPDEEISIDPKIACVDIVIRESVYANYQDFLLTMGNAPKVSVSAPLLNAGLNLGVPLSAEIDWAVGSFLWLGDYFENNNNN